MPRPPGVLFHRGRMPRPPAVLFPRAGAPRPNREGVSVVYRTGAVDWRAGCEEGHCMYAYNGCIYTPIYPYIVPGPESRSSSSGADWCTARGPWIGERAAKKQTVCMHIYTYLSIYSTWARIAVISVWRNQRLVQSGVLYGGRGLISD